LNVEAMYIPFLEVQDPEGGSPRDRPYHKKRKTMKRKGDEREYRPGTNRRGYSSVQGENTGIQRTNHIPKGNQPRGEKIRDLLYCCEEKRSRKASEDQAHNVEGQMACWI